MRRMLRAAATPHDIALGFACGTFWCVLPTPGLSVLLAFATAGLIRMSRLSLVASVIVWNPLFVLPIYPALAIPLGSLIVGETGQTEFQIEIKNTVARLGGKLFVGSAIVGTIMSIVAYFMVRRATEAYQVRKAALKEKRLLARKHRPSDPAPKPPASAMDAQLESADDAEPCALPLRDDQ